jgi:hypothetical protein
MPVGCGSFLIARALNAAAAVAAKPARRRPEAMCGNVAAALADQRVQAAARRPRGSELAAEKAYSIGKTDR